LQPPRSILFLHAGALGDLVLALHVITSLRRQYPEARVDGVARSALVRWAAGRDAFDRAFDPETVRLVELYADPPSLDGTFADFVRDYDWVISFLGGEHAPVTRSLAVLHDGLVVGLRPHPVDRTLAKRIHVTSQWSQRIRECGVEFDSLVPVEFDGPVPPDRPRDILVHPGSGGDHKCCPVAVFADVVRHIRDQGHRVTWMVGPAEMERHRQAELDAWASIAPVAHEPSIAKAAERVRRATDFLGNDSGMTHVAAACGLRTVVVFGPTDPAVWCPLGREVHPVELHFARADANPAAAARTIIEALEP
jgi:hypothetical protein